ncbi:unnamed protein product [Notodromas monacha]|uniref:Uncharacterized protein n=1 Tax=Notodromas monacha TaxID=399045 RepID=A0A7R9BY25_9CRUS|nr:unnamed protein product [Notodromas monacha]CAG0922532.1 unnamed protein product [Notodromas monacha]
MKVNPADLKPKRPVHTLSGDGEPEEEAGADSEEEEPAVVDPRSNNEEEESDDTGATTQSRASRDKMAAQDAEEATDDEEDYYPEIHLASVSCGNKRATGNIVTMLRTIATFLESDEYFISVHVVCDNEHLEGIRREVASWTAEILKRLHVSLYSTTIPKNMTTQLFNKMNSAEAGFECAFQKLFLSVDIQQPWM